MPELPEIETIKRIIGPQITGRRIDETVIMRPEVIARPLADQFCKGTTGRMSAGNIAGFSKGETYTCDFSTQRRAGTAFFRYSLFWTVLASRLGKRRKTIKECLLEQSVIAGIGNIYSDEILFAAGIHPARPANTLTMDEWQRLAAVLPERLSFFIDKNATTPEEYLRTKGQDYRNTPFLQVYGHSGESCPVCKATLCRIVIGGRSSVYCPCCQKC